MGSGNWFVTESWLSYTIPGTTEGVTDDIVVINDGGVANLITNTANIGTGVLQLGAGRLNILNGGTLNIGTVNLGANGYLAPGAGGTLNVSAAFEQTGGTFAPSSTATTVLNGSFAFREGLWEQSSGTVTLNARGNFGSSTSADTVNMKLSGTAKIVETERLLLGSGDINGGGVFVAELRGSSEIESSGYLIVAHGSQHAKVSLYDNAILRKGSGQKVIVGDNGSTGTLNLYGDSQIISAAEVNVGWSGSTGTLYMEGNSKVNATGQSVMFGYTGTNTKSTLTMAGHASIVADRVDMARDGSASAVVTMGGDSTITALVEHVWLTRNTSAGTKDEAGNVTKYSGELTMNDRATINVNQGNFFIGYYSGGSIAKLVMNNDATINIPVGGAWIGDTGGSRGDVYMHDNSKFDVGTFNVSSGGGTGNVYLYDDASIITTGVLAVGNWDGTGLIEFHDRSKATVGGNLGAGADVGGRNPGPGTIRLFDDAVVDVSGSIALGRDGRRGYLELAGSSQLNAPTSSVVIGQYAPQSWMKLSGTATAEVGSILAGHWGEGGGWIELLNDSTFTANGDILLASDFSTGILDVRNTADFIAKGSKVILGFNRQDVTTGTGGTGSINLYNEATFTAQTGDVVLGRTGAGNLNINDTAAFAIGGTGNLYVGGDGLGNNRDAREPVGNVNLTGGALNVGGKIILGAGISAGRQVYNEAGNPVEEEGAPVLTQGGVGHATVVLNGGSVATQGFVKDANAGTVSVTLSGVTVTALAASADFFEGVGEGELVIGDGGAVFDTNGHAIGITTALTGTGDLTVDGAGALTLSGDNSGWTGAVNVTSGTVAIENGTVLKFVLDGAGASATGADAENVYAGPGITIGDVALHIVLNNPSAITQAGEYIYNVFTGATVNGTVTVLSATDAGYTATYIGNGQVKLTVVPEPSSYALLVGVVLLGGVALRRRRSAVGV